MANKTVNLNKNASALMGASTKVRVRLQDNVLQIRPTDRKSATGLPKGEILIDLREKKQAVRSLRFTLPAAMAEIAGVGAGVQFLTITGKHGWISMRAATAEELAAGAVGQPKPAGGSVSDK